MMTTAIYKYALSIHGPQSVQMPRGARILCTQIQRDIIYLWAEVETEQESLEVRNFYVYGTGHPMVYAQLRKYIGTVQADGGMFVWHVYEVLN